MASAQYVGYWTRENERWYQERLNELNAGTARPCSAAEWKSELRRGSHDTLKVNRHYERSASMFLQ